MLNTDGSWPRFAIAACRRRGGSVMSSSVKIHYFHSIIPHPPMQLASKSAGLNRYRDENKRTKTYSSPVHSNTALGLDILVHSDSVLRGAVDRRHEPSQVKKCQILSVLSTNNTLVHNLQISCITIWDCRPQWGSWRSRKVQPYRQSL